MGQTHSISIQPDAIPEPEAPALEVTSEGPQSISISTDGPPSEGAPEGTEETPSEPQEPTAAERPEWLPEKFQTPEALAQAYQELEGKLGSPKAEEATGEPAGAEAAISESALTPYAEEFFTSGELADESYQALEKMGLSRELVTSFMEGQKARQSQETAQVMDAVGGAEAYQAAVAWAQTSMSPEDIAAFNEVIASDNVNSAIMAARGLVSMYSQAQGTSPKLLATEPAGTGSGAPPYESLAQLTADMQDPKYSTDVAFRRQVERRLKNSTVI